MIRLLTQSVLCLMVLTVLAGFVYPLVVTGIAAVAFPHQAHGSLIVRDGRTVGSELIGQPFTDPKYFWAGRRPPRATVNRALQRPELRRLEPRADQPGPRQGT